MEIAPDITVNPAICGGTPCLAGTRIPVSIVISAMASEMTDEEVLSEYILTREQIKRALLYAAGLAKHVEVFPIGA
jgi:uncharacterized protein (DUF433 family)